MNKENITRGRREQDAASWMWRFDRGLSANEQDAFFDWLAANPENSNAFAKNRRNWKRLDKLGDWLPEHSDQPNPDLLALSPRSKLLKYVTFSFAAAAALALSVIIWQANTDNLSPSVAVAQQAEPENRIILEDGSIVKLKDNAKVSILYTLAERRVRLDKGEAFFIVAKNPNRPFVVEVQGIEVSALGTAFNVRLDSESFEVLVSEGIVRVDSAKIHYDEQGAKKTAPVPLLEANQRAVISLTAEPEIPEIATLTKGEIHRVLAWQHGLMTFSSKPLSEIIYELNHFNETQMVVVDGELAAMRFSGSFRSDNMDGFVRLLEVAFGARAEWKGESEILLSKKVD